VLALVGTIDDFMAFVIAADIWAFSHLLPHMDGLCVLVKCIHLKKETFAVLVFSWL
jgi:hypothetical protein